MNKTESPMRPTLVAEPACRGPAVRHRLPQRAAKPLHTGTVPGLLSGEKHPSHFLSGRIEGRPFAIDVPEELRPEVRLVLGKWTCLEDPLHQTIVRYTQALNRSGGINVKVLEMTRTRDPQLSFADLEFLNQNVRLEPVLQAISNFID